HVTARASSPTHDACSAEALQASIPGFVAFFGVVCVAIYAMCSAFRLVLAHGIFALNESNLFDPSNRSHATKNGRRIAFFLAHPIKNRPIVSRHRVTSSL